MLFRSIGAETLAGASGALGGKALQANLAARGLAETGLEGVARKGAMGAAGKLGGLAEKIATPAGLGGLAAGIGTTVLGAPALAGALAAKAAPAAKATAGGAAGLAVPAMQPGGQFDAGSAVPGGLPIGAAPATTLDVIDPSGRFGAMRTAGLLEGDVQLANMKKMMPYLFQAAEARSKSEMQRQLTAAGVRQNIATAANMLERSQQAAQQMGQTAASQAGAALTSQYQYQ